MSVKSTIRTTFLSMTLAALSISATTFSYADVNPIADFSTQNLVAGFGSNAIGKQLMNTAPAENALTILIDNAHAAYLISPNSPITKNLFGQIVNLGEDNANDILSFTWSPNSETDPNLTKEEPIKSVDTNNLLQPIAYNASQAAHAKNVINALGGTLLPLEPVNFNRLIANLDGDKNTNLKATLREKKTQEYLSTLRSYLAVQTVALGNLYHLYSERQVIDTSKLNDPALKTTLNAVAGQIKGPLSWLKIENFMATHRISNPQWYSNLVQENPATLQREQVQLLAENLAESYKTRMTMERLLATMSVLVLELNLQIRGQVTNQINTMNNPSKK